MDSHDSLGPLLLFTSRRLAICSSSRSPPDLAAVRHELPLATHVLVLHGLVVALNPLDFEFLPEPKAPSGLGLLGQESLVLCHKTFQQWFPPGLELPLHDLISISTTQFVFWTRKEAEKERLLLWMPLAAGLFDGSTDFKGKTNMKRCTAEHKDQTMSLNM
jgi:hypothetical protein